MKRKDAFICLLTLFFLMSLSKVVPRSAENAACSLSADCPVSVPISKPDNSKSQEFVVPWNVSSNCLFYMLVIPTSKSVSCECDQEFYDRKYWKYVVLLTKSIAYFSLVVYLFCFRLFYFAFVYWNFNEIQLGILLPSVLLGGDWWILINTNPLFLSRLKDYHYYINFFYLDQSNYHIYIILYSIILYIIMLFTGILYIIKKIYTIIYTRWIYQ